MTTEEFFNSGKCLARQHEGSIQIMTAGIVGSDNRKSLAVKNALNAAALAVHKVECMAEQAVEDEVNSWGRLSDNITSRPE